MKKENVENHPGHERHSAVTWTTGNDSHVLHIFFFSFPPNFLGDYVSIARVASMSFGASLRAFHHMPR